MVTWGGEGGVVAQMMEAGACTEPRRGIRGGCIGRSAALAWLVDRLS